MTSSTPPNFPGEGTTYPRVGDLGYCRNCGEAIIAEATSRASAWAHRNTGLLRCADYGTWAAPTEPEHEEEPCVHGWLGCCDELPAPPRTEPELERLRRLPTTEPLTWGLSAEDAAQLASEERPLSDELPPRPLTSPDPEPGRSLAELRERGWLTAEESTCPNCGRAPVETPRCLGCGAEEMI